MNILPWSITWGADDDRRHPPETGDLEKTPMGGLILHWITTVTSILATIQIHDILNAINFPGLLQSVAHAVILIPLSLGFFRLRSRAAALGFEREKLRPVDRFLTSIWYDNNVWVLSTLAAVILAYAACNVFFVVDFIIPPYDGVDGWVPLAFVAFFVALAVSYYFSFFGSYLPDPDAEDSNFRDDIGPETQGPPEKMRFSFLALADVEMTIRKADTFDESTQEAQRFGSRRKIRYQVSCPNSLISFSIGILIRTPSDRTVMMPISFTGSSVAETLTNPHGLNFGNPGTVMYHGFKKLKKSMMKTNAQCFLNIGALPPLHLEELDKLLQPCSQFILFILSFRQKLTEFISHYTMALF